MISIKNYMKNYVKVELLSKYFVSLFCGLKYAKKDQVYQTKLDTIFIKFIKKFDSSNVEAI